MKVIFWYNSLSYIMSMLMGYGLGYYASKYNLWILILFIPYLFQLTFAIIFKHKQNGN